MADSGIPEETYILYGTISKKHNFLPMSRDMVLDAQSMPKLYPSAMGGRMIKRI